MKKKWLYILVVLIVVGVVLVKQNSNKDNLQVIFFDIGQGDSHFIRTPGGQNILIDGGPDNTVLEKLGKYMPVQDRVIDLMILTHPHADHVTGLVEVMKRYDVARVLATGVVHTTDSYLAWLDLIKEQEVQFDQAIAPKKYIFESEQGEVVLEVLYPDRDLSGEEFDDLNDSSVVVMVKYLDKKFLFTGDVPEENEKRMIYNEVDLKADVLKVSHQGSDTSTSEAWLDAVRPEYAVIPVGENDYGHPSLRIIRRLERAGVRVFRTDEDGDVRFEVNKQGELILNN